MIEGARASRAHRLRASMPTSIHDIFNSSVLSNPARAFESFRPKIAIETPMTLKSEDRNFISIVMPNSTAVHREIVSKTKDTRNRTSRTIFLPALNDKKIILRDSIESERSVFVKN